MGVSVGTMYLEIQNNDNSSPITISGMQRKYKRILQEFFKINKVALIDLMENDEKKEED
jgi:hypothetical protein